MPWPVDNMVLFALFVIVVALIAAALLLRRAQHEERLAYRLSMVSSSQTKLDNPDKEANLPTWLGLSSLLNSDNQNKLKHELARAGFNSPQALNVLLLIKLSMALLCAGVFLFQQGNFSALVLIQTIAIALIANMLPELLVKRRAKTIRQRISRQLPEAIDLLVICAESGLTIDASLAKVAQALAPMSPELAREVELTHMELQLPRPRDLAWQNLAQRNGIKAFENLGYTMIQTERYGTALAPALRELSSETRTLRMLSVEEQIGKIAGKMGIPLMVFIVLPLVVMLAGPAFIKIGRSLSGG